MLPSSRGGSAGAAAGAAGGGGGGGGTGDLPTQSQPIDGSSVVKKRKKGPPVIIDEGLLTKSLDGTRCCIICQLCLLAGPCVAPCLHASLLLSVARRLTSACRISLSQARSLGCDAAVAESGLLTFGSDEHLSRGNMKRFRKSTASRGSRGIIVDDRTDRPLALYYVPPGGRRARGTSTGAFPYNP